MSNNMKMVQEEFIKIVPKIISLLAVTWKSILTKCRHEYTNI
jgi:hypothetical protein